MYSFELGSERVKKWGHAQLSVFSSFSANSRVVDFSLVLPCVIRGVDIYISVHSDLLF